jgi:hypothetical protein
MEHKRPMYLVTDNDTLGPAELSVGQDILDDVVRELSISSATARRIGADLVIRMMADGQRDPDRLKAALKRFLCQLKDRIK